MATEEYLTFTQTVEKLGITEDELLNLVSGNQLRAFRIDRETKFRLQDVEQLCKEGGTVLAAQESAVLDFDDLPDDIQLVNDKPAEPLAELSVEPEIALVEEPAAEPAIDFGSDSLEVLEPATDSNPELEETVMTDSSQIAHTEELSIDEDNFDFSTQEVTIHEDALSEDEVASDQTSVDETIPVEEEAAAPAHYTSSRATAARSAGRRPVFAPAPATSKSMGDLIWTGVLGLLVAAMVYPALLLGTVLFYGVTTGSDMIAPSQVTWDDKHNTNISPIWVPKTFQWVQDKNLKDYFGSATFTSGQANGQTKVPLTFEERERLNMFKITAPAAAASEKKEEAAPANP